jgi:phosphoribosyl 1,2-cyclic phosphate phosphodiesterase
LSGSPDDVLRFTVLGCGASPGVPRIGGDWGNCDPANPKNRRRRCSLFVQRITPAGATRVLIDTSPDLREQALAAGIGTIDGVLFTHPHADHIHGIDDLRGFVINMRRRVDIYADATTMARLKEAFGYCFATPAGSEYPPILNAHDVRAGETLTIAGAGGAIAALPVDLEHGRIRSLAFRFGGLAYLPDVSDLGAEAERRLQDLDVLILNALRRTPHPSHLAVDQSLAWIERLRPKHAVLTHMHSDLDYETLRRTLPPHVEPAYDGMVIELPTLAADVTRMSEAKMASQLVNVRYMVDDVEVAVAWYTNHLGFKLLSNQAPAFADVTNGSLRLLLSGPKSSAGRPMPDGELPRPGGWNRIHLIVEDLAAEVARLRGAGVRFRNEVVTGPGGSQILLVDPSGNVVELFQPARR